jgi:hypothetical protein
MTETLSDQEKESFKNIFASEVKKADFEAIILEKWPSVQLTFDLSECELKDTSLNLKFQEALTLVKEGAAALGSSYDQNFANWVLVAKTYQKIGKSTPTTRMEKVYYAGTYSGEIPDGFGYFLTTISDFDTGKREDRIYAWKIYLGEVKQGKKNGYGTMFNQLASEKIFKTKPMFLQKEKAYSSNKRDEVFLLFRIYIDDTGDFYGMSQGNWIDDKLRSGSCIQFMKLNNYELYQNQLYQLTFDGTVEGVEAHGAVTISKLPETRHSESSQYSLTGEELFISYPLFIFKGKIVNGEPRSTKSMIPVSVTREWIQLILNRDIRSWSN